MPKPILQILLLAGLCLAIDRAMATGPGAPRTIVVGSEVEIDAVEAFEESHGREPTEQELGTLHGGWLNNEALYREGLSLQLDKDDDVIRERVITRMLAVIDVNLRPPAIDDAQLRAWFESRRGRYDEPALYDFQEAALPGKPSESDVRAITTALNAGTAPGPTRWRECAPSASAHTPT